MTDPESPSPGPDAAQDPEDPAEKVLKAFLGEPLLWPVALVLFLVAATCGATMLVFAIRLRGDLRVTTAEGHELALNVRLHWRRRGKVLTGWLGTGAARGRHRLSFIAKPLGDGEWLILATNAKTRSKPLLHGSASPEIPAKNVESCSVYVVNAGAAP